MRNRELVFKRIEQIEIQLEKLRFQTTRPTPLKEFLKEIENTKEILGDLKSMIEREPMDPGEINPR